MDSIIDLSPTMQGRLKFQHDLLDTANDYRCSIEDAKDKDTFILGHMWLVKDVVMRFRFHWPETRPFTDDMAGVGLVALTEYAGREKWDFNKLQRVISSRIADFINDNRVIVTAPRSTNIRRQLANRPLEYYRAKSLHQDQVAYLDEGPYYVDLLDSIMQLAEVDKEQMRDLILMFLEQEHDIDESSLSEEERLAVEKLSEIGNNLI